MREALRLIYRTLMIGVTIVLGIAAGAAWWYATPGNGLLLVSGILAILTLMAGLSIFKLDWADAEAAIYREIVDDMRAKSPVSLRFAKDGDVEVGLKDGAVSVTYAEPDVNRVDNAMLDEARRMAGKGASIDDICRMVDPEHDAHDPVHRQVFRKIVRAMIEQA